MSGNPVACIYLNKIIKLNFFKFFYDFNTLMLKKMKNNIFKKKLFSPSHKLKTF